MNRWAIVQGGKVVNIVVWDGVAPWTPPDGTAAVSVSDDEWVDIGAVYDPIAIPRFN
jgi:hypothetical protein